MKERSLGHERAALLKNAMATREAGADFSSERPFVSVPERTSGRVDILDLAWAKPFPGIRDAIARAVVRITGRTPNRSSLSGWTLIGKLRSGFAAFLMQTDREAIEPKDLGRDLFCGFQRWLDLPTVNVESRSTSYKIGLYAAAVSLVRAIAEDSDSGVPSEPLPPAPWQNRGRISGRKSSVMVEEDVRKIVRVCADLVRSTSARVQVALDAIDADKAGDEVLTCYSAVPVTERDVVSLQAKRPELLRRLRAHGIADARLILRPQPKDVLPFLVLLAYAFRLNDSVIRTARLTDFTRVPSFGGARVVARPFKPRAHDRVLSTAPITNDAVNPASMLSTIARWLDPMRKEIGTDLLFAVTSLRSSEVITMEERRGEKMLAKNLKSFCSQHGLARFNITMLRTFRLDRSHRLTGGNPMAMKVAASHASVRTSRDHYMTSAGFLREDENLAVAMRRMQFGFIAGGTTATGLPFVDGADAGCTPGWRCASPGASPFAPPRPDGQCVAYGRCPVCPFGRIDLASVECARLALALSRAITDALLHMTPEAWLARLAPIAAELAERVLPAFSPDVLARAVAQPPITLPRPD